MVNALSLKRRRDLWGRRWQYLAVASTLFLGVMLFAASYDAFLNLDASYKSTYARLAFADMTVTGARPGLATRLRALPGVEDVTEREVAEIPVRVDAERTFVGRLVGIPEGTQPTVDRLDVTAGTYLATGNSSEAVLEAHMAANFSLKPGDTVQYLDGATWRRVKTAGVAVSPEYLWPARNAQDVLTDPNDFGVLFVSERLVRTLPQSLRKQQVLIRYGIGTNITALDDQVASFAQQYGADSAITQAEHPSNKTLQLDVLGFREMAVAFPALFLLAAGMATYTLLTRLVFAEREIIGMLRANGFSRWSIERHYLSYGLLLGSGAAMLGIVAGVPLGWELTKQYTLEIGIPDTLLAFHPITPVIGMAFGLLTGVFASLVPARQAAALEPAAAMRGAAPVGPGHRSWLEAALPVLRRAPVRWRMVLRGMGRNPRRSVSTVLGVVLALVLILSSWGLLDTTQILLDQQFTTVNLQSATVVFKGPVSGATVRQVTAIPGVTSAEIVEALGTTAHGSGGEYATQVLAFDPDTTMHGFATSLPANGVLLGKAMRARLGINVGDEVLLSFGTLHTTAPVRVAGFVEEPLGTFVYASRDGLAALLADARPSVGTPRLASPDIAIIMARFAPGADTTSVIARIRALDGVAAVSDSRSLYRLAQQFMGLFYVFIGLMLAFGGVMAFALVYNTMSVNLAERAPELAMMRANGLSRAQAASLLVGENLLLTAIAIPPGLLAGYAAAASFMSSYSSDAFDFSLHMHPLTLLWASLIMLTVSGVSLAAGVRAAGRLDVAKVVRERAA